ncbi:MAG TPA: peptide chain release factor N(5)-glutamine methyltransferase [Candidatus Dormibacteraeota bacterium]|nr:peptide chain release factor N(5)-glutamine methyltransferase [Candidatus Dormibacteraeota bacterium]
MTLIEVLRRATGYLELHGSSSPRLDAEVLLAFALRLRRLDLYLQFERELGEAELVPYRELTARRGRGEPVAYLTGHREFMALDFEVTPDVLVPQPDTEVLVQRAVEWGRARGDSASLRFADVGTGSGCIAVSVAHYLPGAVVDASDVSAAALAVAGINAARLGVGDRVRLREGDLTKPLEGPYDAIVANLPYLSPDAALPAEVTAQPALALFGGVKLINRLLAAAPALLAPGGIALLELDPSVLEALAVPAAFAGWKLHRDLGGHERVLEAWT